ncbi:hypothetical protein HPMBJEAJ_00015 [Aeromonas phage avDM6]|nr:hypothetical protein HPMBJEAJ_00015 [Aeromonas phage avDM6]
MISRFNYDRNNGVDKLINKAKKAIRKVQENNFYRAVESIEKVHKSTIAQSLKLIRKEHLSDIEVSVINIEKGVPRVEYNFKINGENVLSMIFHGSERGVVYVNAVVGYNSVISAIKENE